MNLLELLQKRAKLMDELETLTKGLSDSPSEAELTSFDAKSAEVEALDKQIERAKSVEALRAKNAAPVNPNTSTTSTSPTVPAGVAVKDEPGFNVARIARALAATKGVVREAAGFAAQAFGESHDVTKALSAGNATAGGYTIPMQFVPEVIDLLRARTVIRAMGPATMPLVNGGAEIPRLTQGTQASYIGENQNAPNTEPKFGLIKATAKKLAALTPLSNDLLRYNAVGAESIVRNDLVAAMALAEDGAFLRSPGTQFSPKGIRFWGAAGNIIAANGTVNLQNVKNDLGKLELALQNANVPMVNCGWIMSPRVRMFLLNLVDSNGNAAFPEVANGTLRGYKYKVTTQVPSNLGGGTNESELYFADFNDVVVCDAMSLTMNVSDTAAYFDGSSMQAAFSLDQTVIRVIAEHDLIVRREESVAVLTGVTWAP